MYGIRIQPGAPRQHACRGVCVGKARDREWRRPGNMQGRSAGKTGQSMVVVRVRSNASRFHFRVFIHNIECEERWAGQLIPSGAHALQEDAYMYTTMEPCSQRTSGNCPCVSRILATRDPNNARAGCKITRVYVGAMEPSNFVNCDGGCINTIRSLKAHQSISVSEPVAA